MHRAPNPNPKLHPNPKRHPNPKLQPNPKRHQVHEIASLSHLFATKVYPHPHPHPTLTLPLSISLARTLILILTLTLTLTLILTLTLTLNPTPTPTPNQVEQQSDEIEMLHRQVRWRVIPPSCQWLATTDHRPPTLQAEETAENLVRGNELLDSAAKHSRDFRLLVLGFIRGRGKG